MTLTFTAVNSEFGTATEDNVDVTATTSRFDVPPTNSTDLVITNNPGDPDPRNFEIGDTYDVGWNTPDGANSIQDAVVVRSDDAPGGGGIVVLEGTDADGNPAQVIWTPNFDLADWYKSNYSEGNPPQFYTADTNASYTHTYVCFAAGTLIDTSAGPVRVEELRPGDAVLTLDAGPQPVIWAGRRTCLGYDKAAPVRFDPGVIGNAGPLYLSQNHRVLLRTPHLDLTLGCSEVLVPAKALTWCDGVSLCPQPTITYTHILLADHHLIWANGALCETLLIGPETQHVFRNDPTLQNALQTHGIDHDQHLPARPILTARETRALERILDVPRYAPLRQCGVPRPTRTLHAI